MTLTLIHAPLSRSARILWLLEELAVPYDVKRGAFQPPPWLAAYIKRCIERPAFVRAQAKDNG